MFSTSVCSTARAQWSQSTPGDLSATVRVEEPEPAARALLQRASAHLAEKQWDDAVETLRQVIQQAGGRLYRLDDHHYIPLTDYCQMQLAAMPPEALAIYRGRVDASAKRWYDEGITARDPALLQRVIDELFVSSWGDSALLAEGEIALEAGDYQQARWCWERISPELRSADDLPLWLTLRAKQRAAQAVAADQSPASAEANRSGNAAGSSKENAPSARWLAYPDTKLNLADIRARLVLVSILEGATARARIELEELNRRQPNARGTIGGREGPYSELLGRQLALAETRPAPPPQTTWPTFGGSPERSTHAAVVSPIRGPIWEIPLVDGEPWKADISIIRGFGLPEHRVGEEQMALLSFHPLVVGRTVLFNSLDKIYAFDLHTGNPTWPLPPGIKDRDSGEIYSGTRDQPAAGRTDFGNLFRTLGVPRFTMTVVGNRLYARLGSPITSRPPESGFSTGYSYLVCLDLAAEGRLMWRVPPAPKEDDRWAFEGSPLSDGNNVYVAMRYSDVRPQEHVACFDAQTGVMRWRRLVCTAESPARGQVEEVTNNLLTLAHDTLYLNTNLGAVAALSTADGRIRWVSLYPRSGKSLTDVPDAADHFYRDLNPCVYSRGSLFVAPTDYEGILALDAATGELLWASDRTRDVVHLLGVGGNNLIASGRRLWWLNVDSGKVVYFWPDHATASSYGRGALVGDEVYFPTRTELHVFRQAVERPGPNGAAPTVEIREPVRLDMMDPPTSGGNLVAAAGYLLVATPRKLVAFGPGAPPKAAEDHGLTQSVPRDSFRADPSVLAAPQPSNIGK
jgi:outer membrane protein assembly factor BamB